MQIYQSTVSLRSGALKTYETGKAASFYYANRAGGLLVIVNTGNEPLTMKTPIERAGDRMKNLMNQETVTLPAVMNLEPYQYLILEKE